MRRRFLFAIAALIALVSSMIVSPSPATSTPNGSLTVVAIDRTGVPVRSDLVVVHEPDRRTYFWRTGAAHRLPTGWYLLFVDIYGVHDIGSSTLGVRRVHVSGATTVAFRARRGKLVRLAVEPRLRRGYANSYLYALCLAGGSGEIFGASARGYLYVLPSSVAGTEFAYSAAFERSESENRYFVAGAYHGGLPDGVTRRFKRANLTPVRLAARTGPVNDSASVGLLGTNLDGCLATVLQFSTSVDLPAQFTTYVQSGRWSVHEEGMEAVYSGYRAYSGASAHFVPINHAIWGPDGRLPYIVGTGRLYLNATQMITDPTLSEGSARARVTYRLTHAGQTIAEAAAAAVGARKILNRLAVPGWYTLTATARRPSDRLYPGLFSPRVQLKLHFHEDLLDRAQVRGYVTRFVPTGLDVHNRAAPGSRTVVLLRLQRDRPSDPSVSQPADAVKDVSVWWSGNAGGTWRQLPITRRQGHRAVVVPNPPAGRVSLRATVTDVHGDWSQTTVTSGYAVR